MKASKLKKRAEHYREVSMMYATGTPLPIVPAKHKTPKYERRKAEFLRRSSPEKLAFAEKLLKNMTPAEKHLWKILKKADPLFTPQAIVHGYIADFCAFKYKLIVEIDGSVHDKTDQITYDRARDVNLFNHGYRTLRFPNDEVLHRRQSVVGLIMESL